MEAAGFKILGTPFDAVDLAEDRERFGALLGELGIRCPGWGTAAGGDEAVAVAGRIGYPVLVRPSYVLGGRAMRVCYGPDDVRAAMVGVAGRVLVDRFLENAVEIDVDALCDGTDTFVAAVMEHVEERRACTRATRPACCRRSRCRLGRRSRSTRSCAGSPRRSASWVSSTSSSPWSRARCSCWRSTRARLADECRSPRRRSPSTSWTRRAALAGGARIDLGLVEREPDEVSVKAAVLPFGRFPGADPVLGPEMRSTGEVMASASDMPTAFARPSGRRAGRAA